MARTKTRVYVLQGEELQVIPPDGTKLKGTNDIMVYYSPVHKAITVVSNMKEDIAFWRQLRLACGVYNIYNSEMYSKMKRDGFGDDRKIRYKVRNSQLQKVFKFVEFKLIDLKKKGGSRRGRNK